MVRCCICSPNQSYNSVKVIYGRCDCLYNCNFDIKYEGDEKDMNWDQAISNGQIYWLLVVIVILLLLNLFRGKNNQKSSKTKHTVR